MRKPLEQQEDIELEKNRGLKLKPSKKFEEPKVQKQVLEERAEDISARMQQYFTEAHDLGKKYLELMKDKTLLNNKGPIQKNLEKEVLANINKYVEIVNNDDEHPYNDAGSSAIIALLLAVNIKLRDRCNEMEFLLEKSFNECDFLKKEFVDIKLKIMPLIKKSE